MCCRKRSVTEFMQESIVFLLRVQCRRTESSRSLSHLMMSFLLSVLTLVCRLSWLLVSFKYTLNHCTSSSSSLHRDYLVFSERELKFMFAICHRRSVCLSVVCLWSVTLVHPTQAIKIFGNISTPCGTLAIHDLCIKILRRSSQGNPSVGGVKHKRGSQI